MSTLEAARRPARVDALGWLRMHLGVLPSTSRDWLCIAVIVGGALVFWSWVITRLIQPIN